MPVWLLVLACPIGMGLMMFFMMRGMKHERHEDMPSKQRAATPGEDVARLEREKQALEQKIARLKSVESAPEKGAAREPKHRESQT